MKKAVVFLLLITYAAVTSGMTVNYHYCMNKLDKTSLFTTKSDDTCGRCGMETSQSNGCCKDEVKLVKLDDEQNRALYLTDNKPFFVLLPITLPATSASVLHHVLLETTVQANPPPLLKGQKAYLFHNVFRI